MKELEYRVRFLASERFGTEEAKCVVDSCQGKEDALFAMYRRLVNTRDVLPNTDEFLRAQDRMLQKKILNADITDAADLTRVPLDARMSL